MISGKLKTGEDPLPPLCVYSRLCFLLGNLREKPIMTRTHVPCMDLLVSAVVISVCQLDCHVTYGIICGMVPG